MKKILSDKNDVKRILIITSNLNCGGRQRQIIQTIKLLYETGHFIIGIICLEKNQYYSEQAKKYTNFFIELEKKYNKIMLFLLVWKQFVKFKPVIVHTWDFYSSFFVFLPIKYYKVKFINGSIRDAGVEKSLRFLLKKFLLKIQT